MLGSWFGSRLDHVPAAYKPLQSSFGAGPKSPPLKSLSILRDGDFDIRYLEFELKGLSLFGIQETNINTQYFWEVYSDDDLMYVRISSVKKRDG